MKLNICDFCLGGVDGEVKLTFSKFSVGWKGHPRAHACDKHAKILHTIPKPTTSEEIFSITRRIQNRAMAGLDSIDTRKLSGSPAERALGAGARAMSKEKLAEPYWGKP